MLSVLEHNQRASHKTPTEETLNAQNNFQYIQDQLRNRLSRNHVSRQPTLQIIYEVEVTEECRVYQEDSTI